MSRYDTTARGLHSRRETARAGRHGHPRLVHRPAPGRHDQAGPNGSLPPKPTITPQPHPRASSPERLDLRCPHRRTPSIPSWKLPCRCSPRPNTAEHPCRASGGSTPVARSWGAYCHLVDNAGELSSSRGTRRRRDGPLRPLRGEHDRYCGRPCPARGPAAIGVSVVRTSASPKERVVRGDSSRSFATHSFDQQLIVFRSHSWSNVLLGRRRSSRGRVRASLAV